MILGKLHVIHYQLTTTVINYLLILQVDIQKLAFFFFFFELSVEKLPNNITLRSIVLWQGTFLAMERGTWTLSRYHTSTLGTHYVGFFSSLLFSGSGCMSPWLPTIASEYKDWREGLKIQKFCNLNIQNKYFPSEYRITICVLEKQKS